MIYAIEAFGLTTLRQKAKEVKHGADVKEYVESPFETMDAAQGVGLAGPQLQLNMRMFVADFGKVTEDGSVPTAGRKAFINPEITIDTSVPLKVAQEGCLSITGILVDVPRHEKVTIRYFEVVWQLHEETWTGFPARIIQHEYDHLEGKLHVDYVSREEDQQLTPRLRKISDGNVEVSYKMRYPARPLG